MRILNRKHLGRIVEVYLYASIPPTFLLAWWIFFYIPSIVLGLAIAVGIFNWIVFLFPSSRLFVFDPSIEDIYLVSVPHLRRHIPQRISNIAEVQWYRPEIIGPAKSVRTLILVPATSMNEQGFIRIDYFAERDMDTNLRRGRISLDRVEFVGGGFDFVVDRLRGDPYFPTDDTPVEDKKWILGWIERTQGGRHAR